MIELARSHACVLLMQKKHTSLQKDNQHCVEQPQHSPARGGKGSKCECPPVCTHSSPLLHLQPGLLEEGVVFEHFHLRCSGIHHACVQSLLVECCDTAQVLH